MSALNATGILGEVGRLWASLGASEGEGASHGVLRACAMTLVVFVDDKEAEGAGETLAELMREHPHRAIVLRIRAATGLEYQVRAQCWMPFGRRQQICGEHIEISCGREDLPGLAPVLTALAAPDVPLVVWLRDPRVYDSGVLAPAQRIIVDSAAFADPRAALGNLARDSGRVSIGDLAWTRLTRWREIVAQSYDDANVRRALASLDRVRVLHGGAAVPPEAWYLAAWVLGAAKSDAGVRFESASGREPIQGVELSSAGTTLSARRQDGWVDIRAGALHTCSGNPDRTEASALLEELGIAGRDPVYDNALRLAARMAAGERG